MIGTRAMLFATFVSIGGALFGYDSESILRCRMRLPLLMSVCAPSRSDLVLLYHEAFHCGV